MGRWKYASNVFIFVASVTFLFMFEKSYWLALKKKTKVIEQATRLHRKSNMSVRQRANWD